MELHDQWLEKATRDIRTASLLLESEESLLNMVVYHAQQCDEKALKAFMPILANRYRSHTICRNWFNNVFWNHLLFQNYSLWLIY